MASDSNELIRLRHELALRDATILAERAKFEALEIRIQLKEREEEIEKLRAALTSARETTARDGSPLPNKSPKSPIAAASSGAGATNARGVVPASTAKTTRETANDFAKRMASTRAPREGKLSGSKRRRQIPDRYRDDVYIVAKKRFQEVKTETPNVTKQAKKLKHEAKKMEKTENKSKTNASLNTLRAKGNAKPPPVDGVKRTKKCFGYVIPLDGPPTAHGEIKIRKTTKMVPNKDGTFTLVPIPGAKFCHRCKRTNQSPENMEFAEGNSSLCVACSERVKICEALRGGRSPNKKTTPTKEVKLPPVGPDGKRVLLSSERTSKWSAMVRANVDGNIDKCETLRLSMIDDKKLFRNFVPWDEEFIQTTAVFGKHPLRMINWALSNGASMDERAAKNACERKETVHNTPAEGEGAYIPAVKVLKHLIKCGCRVTCDVMHVACASGDLECVKYLKENVRICDFKGEWKEFGKRVDGQDNELMLIAAQEGHVEILEYLYDNDCDFSVEDSISCVELAKHRKPRTANYEKVIEYIQSLPEWAEHEKYRRGDVVDVLDDNANDS